MVTEDARGPWRFMARTKARQGALVNEDAWKVETGVAFLGSVVDVAAVFDGVGGMPNARRASEAAGRALREAVQDAAEPLDVLRRLNLEVGKTGGACTAVIVILSRPPSAASAWVLSVGDGGAYIARGREGVKRLNPQDSGGGRAITDFLGNPEMNGHAVRFEPPTGTPVLLCTDGLDAVAESEEIEALVRARPAHAQAAAEATLAAVAALGPPDDATFVLATMQRGMG